MHMHSIKMIQQLTDDTHIHSDFALIIVHQLTLNFEVANSSLPLNFNKRDIAHTLASHPFFQNVIQWNISIKDPRYKDTSLIRTLPVVPAT